MESERLEIIPLAGEQLKKLIDDLPALQSELNCTYQAEPLQGFF